MSDSETSRALPRPDATPTSLRARAEREHPDFPFLAVDRPEEVGRWLADAGWLDAGEAFDGCERAGEGNMNLTLRVRTSRRRFILKQARPWVEKYDHIAAPWERSLIEQRFYQRVAGIRGVASRMPRLLGCDAEARVILLEDLPGARDFSDLYAAGSASKDTIAARRTLVIEEAEVDVLCDYLVALHSGSAGPPDPQLANRAMRELNHAHLFEVPLDRANGLDLDAHEPGLAAVARQLMDDELYRRAVAEMGNRYLEDGRCLVHGDYFPGSWLRCDGGVRVIDPEFAFCGDPELDLGMAIAHFALASQPFHLALRMLDRYSKASGSLEIEPGLLAGYAAVEVMRRLIGVAQLPIAGTAGLRRSLLERSREALRSRGVDPLFGRTPGS